GTSHSLPQSAQVALCISLSARSYDILSLQQTSKSTCIKRSFCNFL
ncbi:uncharacterized protein METZ01_LOCUS348444, partial [marine metagenome]